MKRFLKSSFSIFLAITIIFSSAIVGLNEIDFSGIKFENPFAVKSKAASSGTCGYNLTWTLDDAGTLTISGTGDMQDYYYEYVPWYSVRLSIINVIINNGVKSIGDYAFYKCTSLTSITIPNSVKSIGDYAFYGCTSLTSITIPNSVKSIGDYAFRGCTSLTTITIPDSVTSIGDYAFRGCTSLTTIAIPNSVTSIGVCAFYGCTNLTSITIPDSVTSIGDSAFYGCTNLTTIAIPNSVTSIGDYVFRDCTNLTTIAIPNSVTSIGDSAFYGCTNLTTIAIPNSVTSIGDYAFCECKSLTSITIPDSVTSIRIEAFYGCKSLTSITIPDSVTSIGREAFSCCTSLTSIVVDPSNENYGSVDGVLLNKNKTEIIKYPQNKTNTDYTIPDSVTSIGDDAFCECKSLTSITIPDSVTDIGNSAFSNCTSLTSVTMGNGVRRIADYAFNNCISLAGVYIKDIAAWCNIDFYEIYSNPLYYAKNLYLNGELVTKLVIPDGVTSIGAYAFYGCTNLTDVTIGEGVREIGYEAFKSCNSIKSLFIDDILAWCRIKFEDNYDQGYDDVKDEDRSFGYSNPLYYAENFYVNGELAKDIVIPDGVASISKYAFCGYDMTSIRIPVSLIIVGYYAFWCNVGHVYYEGSKEQWKKISFAAGNGDLRTATRTKPQCSKPKLKKVTNMKSGVKITWSKVEYADSYRVYRKVKGGSWKYLDNTKTTSFIDKTAKSGTKYYYSVRAKNDLGLSERSSTLSIKRLSSSKASKVSNTSSGVKVTWKKVTGASCYIVYRKTKGGKWDAIKKTSKLYYTDTKAKSGKTYIYTVRACSGSERSYYDTDGLSIRRLRTPKISSATSKREGIFLKWNKITGASGYYVYRKASSGEWKKIKTVKGNAKIKYLDETPRKKVTYQYRVKAYYGKSTSYNSNTYKIKCKY